MSGLEPLYLTLLVICIFLSAFFSSSETCASIDGIDGFCAANKIFSPLVTLRNGIGIKPAKIFIISSALYKRFMIFDLLKFD